MREIKFRAWIPSEKTMIGHRETIERAHLQFNDSLNASDMVMQFTGLHDRNGKEWYDGDLVRVRKSGRIFITYFDEDEMGWRIKSAIWNRIPFKIDAPLFEIVGNIYENPELL